MQSVTRNKINILFAFFGSSFLLHLIWENSQAYLYVGFESFAQHFPACLFATATGDMIFMAIIYLVIAAVHKDFWWPLQRKVYDHVGTWIVAILVGVLIAVSFELWAIYVDHRWVYGSMQLVPIIKVGLTPVLQMVIIPPVVIWITRKTQRF